MDSVVKILNKTPRLKDIFTELNSSINGLSDKEAQERLKEFGFNVLEKPKRRFEKFHLFFSKFKNPLIILLLLGTILSAFLGDLLTAFLILFFISLSLGLDSYQTFKSNRAIEKLKNRVKITATVLRDGEKKEIKISEIVPGDIIFLSAGDIIPADAYLISSKDLFVNESVLSGESLPIFKESEKNWFQNNKDNNEKAQMLFAGTTVVSGFGSAVVIRTGLKTNYGKIIENLSELEPETEFDRGIKHLAILIFRTVVFLTIFVFFINSFLNHGVLNSFLFAIALAVGMVPELLPIIITVTLAHGATKMAEKKVIVKKLVAIQNLGNVDVFCTDKTGTLTEDKIKLEKYLDIRGKENKKVLKYAYLNSFFQGGLKSPLSEAILAHKEEIDINGYEKIDEIPFDFSRKFLSVIVEKNQKRELISVGAPESIFSRATFYDFNGERRLFNKEKREKIQEIFKDLSANGFRVLAAAYKEISPRQKKFSKNDETKLVFLGLTAFLDPPKLTAKSALKELEKNGIQFKILTGDNEWVTEYISRLADIPQKKILLGEQIEKMSDSQLKRVVNEVGIFCRVTPEQKERIILALKHNKHVVGYLGDGINDALAMHAADVGISVDNAVDVAKEVADIVLLEKDLNVLTNGVLEGRKTYGNVMKYLMMETSSNFGNMFSVAGASLILPFLPMLPIQIILNNFLYEFSQMALPMDKVDEEWMKKPKKWNVNLIKYFMVIFGPVSSIFDFLTFFLLLTLFKANISLFQTGWFLESLFTQTLIVFAIRTNKTPFWHSLPSRFLILSVGFVLTLSLIIVFSPLRNLFGFSLMPFLYFFLLGILIIAYFFLIEWVKKRFYQRFNL